MGQILRGEPLTIIGDGLQTRCFTYIDDAVRGTVAAGLKPEAIGGVFNIGDDRETSILDLARIMLQIVGRSPEENIRFVRQEAVYGSRYEDIPRRVPSIARMKDILHVKPETSLLDGMTATIEWFRHENEARPALTSASLEATKS
jgi:UDP-glucose 4-epimerase